MLDEVEIFLFWFKFVYISHWRAHNELFEIA